MEGLGGNNTEKTMRDLSITGGGVRISGFMSHGLRIAVSDLDLGSKVQGTGENSRSLTPWRNRFEEYEVRASLDCSSNPGTSPRGPNAQYSCTYPKPVK